MLDTSVAIVVRDGDALTVQRIGAAQAVLMSIVTRVELEGGVWREPAFAALRRARLDVMLDAIPTVDFTAACAQAYGEIVAKAGYSRRKLLDRMIAAQALVHRATLVTKSPADFGDVPGLAIEVW